MQLLLQRLVVIQIRVRWRSVHEQINHPLRLGRKMRQRTQPAIRPAGLARQAVLLQQRIQQLRITYTAKPEAAQQLLKVGEHVRDETLTVTDHAAYTVLCNLLFNLDEVITRE